MQALTLCAIILEPTETAPAGYRARPFRELLAMSVVAVGLLAIVTWMVFLVSGFRWVGASGFKWLVNFF